MATSGVLSVDVARPCPTRSGASPRRMRPGGRRCIYAALSQTACSWLCRARRWSVARGRQARPPRARPHAPPAGLLGAGTGHSTRGSRRGRRWMSRTAFDEMERPVEAPPAPGRATGAHALAHRMPGRPPSWATRQQRTREAGLPHVVAESAAGRVALAPTVGRTPQPRPAGRTAATTAAHQRRRPISCITVDDLAGAAPRRGRVPPHDRIRHALLSSRTGTPADLDRSGLPRRRNGSSRTVSRV